MKDTISTIISYFFAPMIIGFTIFLMTLFSSIIAKRYFKLESFSDSIFFTFKGFLSASSEGLVVTNSLARYYSVSLGFLGIILMGLFVSSSYSSFQRYAEYQENKLNDSRILRVLAEIRQDYINIFSNYGMSGFTASELMQKTKDNESIILQSLYRTGIPDLKGDYHPTGLNAFLKNFEIVDEKLQRLLMIGVESNYTAEIRYITLLSRNLVNDFQWSSIQRMNLQNIRTEFVKTTMLENVSLEKRTGIVIRAIEVYAELESLTKKIHIKTVKNTGDE